MNVDDFHKISRFSHSLWKGKKFSPVFEKFKNSVKTYDVIICEPLRVDGKIKNCWNRDETSILFEITFQRGYVIFEALVDLLDLYNGYLHN